MGIHARRVIFVVIVALLLVGTGCSGATALPTTNEPNAAPTVDPQTRQLVDKVLELSERLELVERQIASRGGSLAGEPEQPVAADPLEEFNRVRRACLMSDLTDTVGNHVFSGSLVSLEFSQQDQDAFRRVFGFIGLSPLAQRAAISAFCQFKGMEPIINFFANQDVETAFRSFLEDRPTQDMLTEELNRILSARQADPHGPAGARFETVFAIPHQAFSAAIQPSLAGILQPDLRRDVWERRVGGFADGYAANPERFQSQDAIVNIFEEYRK